MDVTRLTHATRAICAIALVSALISCSQKMEAPGAAPAPVANMAERSAMAPPQKSAQASADVEVSTASTTQQMGSSALTYSDGERKFIRTASARFQVKDVYVAALGIEDTVAAHGGFVVKNDISTNRQRGTFHPVGNNKVMELSEYAVRGHLIVRVPSAKTQEFLRAIVSHIVFLDQRNFSARDAQFDLLRQQLEMARGQETQQDLGQVIGEGGKLAQKTDAIAARNEAKAARDAALVAKKEFDDQVAFSTIELKLEQPAKLLQTEKMDLDSLYRQLRPGFFSRLGEELREGWTGLLEFVLRLVGIWPVLLAIGLIGNAIWFVRRRRRLSGKAARAD